MTDGAARAKPPVRRRSLRRRVEALPRWLRILLAGTLLAIGAAGLVLPVLPGWVFIVAGLVVLTTVSVTLRRIWHRRLRRHHRLRAFLRKLRPTDRSAPPVRPPRRKA